MRWDNLTSTQVSAGAAVVGLFLIGGQMRILSRQADTQDKQAKTQDSMVTMQTEVHGMALEVARRKIEDDCADAMGLMGSALEVAHRAHATGVRTAYRGMTEATREAANLCDMAWAAVNQTATPATSQPANMVHPDVRPGTMAFVRAELHYYHASTCLHCVDEGQEMVVGEPLTPGWRLDGARRMVDEAGRSLDKAIRCLAVYTGSDTASVDLLRRRIRLRQADADSFRRSLGVGQESETSHTPYLDLLAEMGSANSAAEDPATARFVARAANNYAMALFGSQKTADQAVGQLRFAMDLLFDGRVMRATLASATGRPGHPAASLSEPPQGLATRLHPLWRRVDTARDGLRSAQVSDRERLTCRKMLSTSAAWLFFQSQSPSEHARDNLMRLVTGDLAMVVPPTIEGQESPVTASRPSPDLASLREYLATSDVAWLRRRGYVRLLVALHAALEATPTDDEDDTKTQPAKAQTTRALARAVIETAAEIGTAPRRIGKGIESTSGDWGTYAYLVSRCPDDASAISSSTTDKDGPRFSELGRARRFAELAARRRAGPPARPTEGSALCENDREAIWTLLKHVRGNCGLVGATRS